MANQFFDADEIYLLQISNEPETEIAIRVDEDDNCLRWFDSLRCRMTCGIKIKRNELQLEVRDSMDRILNFQPLSLSDYNKYIRDQLEGKPSFKTRKEMVDFFNNLGSW